MDMLPTDSDWESSSDSGSSEDAEVLDFLYGGQACSILSSLEESIGKIDDFLSFERGFMRGDIVCSVSDPSGQMGKVINVKMLVDLESVHGKKIKNVDSKKLLKIRPISVGDYVVLGPWIGRVDRIIDKLAILFDDGSKCEVTATDQEKLKPLSPNLLDDSLYPYYPGQRVQVRPSTIPKQARRLCADWKKNHDVGTVSAVKAGSAYIDWLACAHVGCDLSLPSPPHLQDARQLTLLSCFSHENWQVGDCCVLSMALCKGFMEQMFVSASNLELLQEHNMGQEFSGQDHHSTFQEIFVIMKTKTVVDVLWQDGSCSLGLYSQVLIPVNVVNAHEFWPGQFVLEKSTCDDQPVSGNQKWGVVKGVDAKEKTVKVVWKSTGMHHPIDVGSNYLEEIVSAYELVEHPDFSFCYGDIVFKNIDQADKWLVNRESGVGNNLCLEGQDVLTDQIDYSSKDYLSCIGYVTGFNDGAVEVTWASGLKTKVQPSEIFRIDKHEGSTASAILFEENIGDLNQEIFDYDNQFPSMKGKDLINSSGMGEEHKKNLKVFKSISFPQSTIGFFANIAASIFGSLGSTSLSDNKSPSHITEVGNQSRTPDEKEISETTNPCTEMQPLIAGVMERFESRSLKQEFNHIQENSELQSSSASRNAQQFKQFEMVSYCSDHHFLDGAGRGTSSQVNRSWLKKVQQEWSMLEKDLPESIYVRIFEERMDLLRAAIVGAPGTPYHDGLFFFDIYLPPEYPHEPPLVHYRSGGLRLNPNLYESGKVCLSLLNTWTGTSSEVWNPECSSILQVLLSLQAIVLNEKPYFNEAGYDKQLGKVEGEKNSVGYNENAFLVTWKSMLYLLRQPPKHFEALVEEHLRLRSEHILSACKAYMEGAAVAHAFGSGEAEQENQKGNSTGFKIMLSKLFPKLVEAFSGKGIDCSRFTLPEN